MSKQMMLIKDGGGKNMATLGRTSMNVHNQSSDRSLQERHSSSSYRQQISTPSKNANNLGGNNSFGLRRSGTGLPEESANYTGQKNELL